MSADGGHLEFPIGQKKKHNFCRGPSNDHSCYVMLSIGLLVSEEHFLKHFPIGSYVKTMSADGGHLEFPIGKKKT